MFELFKHRSRELERLDKGEYTPAEYERWQREMKYIHAIFGEERALKNMLLREIETSVSTDVSVLDVGAGSGGLLIKLGEMIGERRNYLVGAEFDEVAARSIREKRMDAVRCDALRLPFADRSFDYVYCSLFLHHLDDEQGITLLREMVRVSSKRIYVIDLDRDPLSYYAYKFFGWFVLQRFTREDGALSILRSRTSDELKQIAANAGLEEIRVERSLVNRLVLSGR